MRRSGVRIPSAPPPRKGQPNPSSPGINPGASRRGPSPAPPEGKSGAEIRPSSGAMRFLYNLLFNVGFLLSAPFYFLKMYRRGNWVAGFGQRFGQYDGKLKQALTNRRTVWLHAVSVGEV